MIKFFRKIRQNLLMENKTGKYFKYAIGEIILVVIGILIAVQINTWIKNSEIRKNNKIYITKIIGELKLNKKRLEYLAFDGDSLSNNLPSLKRATEDADSILKLSFRGLKKSDLQFLLTANIYSGGSQLNLYDATYEELLNTGKLYSLGSDKTILAIKNYYKRYEREIEYNRRWTGWALEGMNILGPNYFKILFDYYANPQKFNWKNYPWYFNPQSEKYTKLQMGVSRVKNGQLHDLRKCKEIIKDTDKLILILEKVLEEERND